MSCKPFKTTEANAKSFLRTKGAIDKFLNIIDLNKFRQYHAELKQQVKKYIPDFQDNLFFELDGGKKASPNKNIFQQIDNSKGIYYSKKSENQIDYSLKAIDILNSDKAKQIFAKGEKANWDLNKILTELQIPKEQKQLVENIYNDKINSIIKTLEKNCE